MARSVLSITSLGVATALLGACGSEVVQGEPGTGGSGGGATSAAVTTTAATTQGTGAGDTVGAPCSEQATLRCGGGADEGAILQCQDGQYAAIGRCDEGAACQDVQGADAVACGSTFFGVEGTPCTSAATQVCSLDRAIVLGCDAGTWAAFTHCAPTRCVDVPPAPGSLCSGAACEGCGYTIGDRCAFPGGTVNCSTTGDAIVACADGTVTLFEDCASQGLTCRLSGGVIDCL